MSEQQQSMLLELFAEVKQLRKEVKSSSAAGKLPDEKISDIFAEWERDELLNKRSERCDGRVSRGHIPLILDLPFEFEGETLTMGALSCAVLTAEHGEAWKNRLKLSEPGERTAVRESYRTRKNLPPDPIPPGKREHIRYLSGATINRIVTTAQACLTWRLNGRMSLTGRASTGRRLNPLKGLSREQANEPRQGYFENEEQFEDFLRFCCPILQDMLRLAVNSGGMRKREFRLLKIGEIDWQQRVIILARGKGKNRRTKNGKGRVFPILDAQFEMLLRRRAQAEAIGSEYIFFDPSSPTGEPVKDRTLGSWMAKAAGDPRHPEKGGWCKLINGERPILHSTRHTWGTWAAAKGYDSIALKQEGGWSDDRVIMGYVKQGKALISGNRAKLSRSISDVQREADEGRGKAA